MMSLETADIQEVFTDIAAGKLELVQHPAIKRDESLWLEEKLRILENCFGDLKSFELSNGGYLFPIELALTKPQHKELKKRWDKAIKLSSKVRMQILRCKALEMLENFSDETKAPVNAFCKIILSDILSENTERIKARYAYRGNSNTGPDPEDEEADDIADQLDRGED